MMDEWLKYLPLLNVFVIPGVVVLWKLAQAAQEIRAFMAESKADRATLHGQVDRMERQLLRKGVLDAS